MSIVRGNGRSSWTMPCQRFTGLHSKLSRSQHRCVRFRTLTNAVSESYFAKRRKRTIFLSLKTWCFQSKKQRVAMYMMQRAQKRHCMSEALKVWGLCSRRLRAPEQCLYRPVESRVVSFHEISFSKRFWPMHKKIRQLHCVVTKWTHASMRIHGFSLLRENALFVYKVSKLCGCANRILSRLGLERISAQAQFRSIVERSSRRRKRNSFATWFARTRLSRALRHVMGKCGSRNRRSSLYRWRVVSIGEKMKEKTLIAQSRVSTLSKLYALLERAASSRSLGSGLFVWLSSFSHASSWPHWEQHIQTTRRRQALQRWKKVSIS